MQQLESIQRSIRNAEDLHDVVRTMKVISAVSIRQYEQAVDSLEDYYRTVEMGLQILLREEPVYPEPVSPSQEEPRLGIIVLGSGQGLCGRFNDSLVQFITDRLNKMPYKLTHVMTVSEHIHEVMDIEGFTVTQQANIPSSVEGINGAVSEVLVSMERWQEADTDRIILFHNRPQGNTGYQSRMHTLYPIEPKQFKRLETKPWPTNNLPQFTMDPPALMRSLISQFFFVSIYRAFAESLASEHANRLASMQAAERKIDERIDKLNSEFRRRRQTAITEEVLDIIASWESVGGVGSTQLAVGSRQSLQLA